MARPLRKLKLRVKRQSQDDSSVAGMGTLCLENPCCGGTKICRLHTGKKVRFQKHNTCVFNTFSILTCFARENLYNESHQRLYISAFFLFKATRCLKIAYFSCFVMPGSMNGATGHSEGGGGIASASLPLLLNTSITTFKTWQTRGGD